MTACIVLKLIILSQKPLTKHFLSKFKMLMEWQANLLH